MFTLGLDFSALPTMTVLDKNGLRIIFNFERDGSILMIHLEATNSTPSTITNFIFKAAVPKVENGVSRRQSITFSSRIFPLNSIRRTAQRFQRQMLARFINRSKSPIRITTNFACELNWIIPLIVHRWVMNSSWTHFLNSATIDHFACFSFLHFSTYTYTYIYSLLFFVHASLSFILNMELFCS